jgi:hypothetical protein
METICPPQKVGLFSKLHGVTAQKTMVFIVTALIIAHPATSVEALLNVVYQVSHP